VTTYVVVFVCQDNIDIIYHLSWLDFNYNPNFEVYNNFVVIRYTYSTAVGGVLEATCYVKPFNF
jgi:hypothetical protein